MKPEARSWSGGWLYRPDPNGGCLAAIVRRLAAAGLAAPVGDRVVLDAATGQPVTQEPT
jgi:hypothetical protein